MSSVALTPYTGSSIDSSSSRVEGFSSDHSHTPTGEWERLVRAAAREQRQDQQHEAQQARLARIREGRERNQLQSQQSDGSGAIASPASPYAAAAAAPSSHDGFFEQQHQQQQARFSPHTPAVRPGGFPFSDTTMPSPTAASPVSAAYASFAAASSPTAAPTPAVLAGVQSCLGSLLRLAQGEATLDAMRERLHSLPCVRPLSSESLQFPGGIEEDEAMRGGFKPGSWISRRAAASVPLFKHKLHTTLHAVSGLPVTSAEAPAIFVPNTYFLWLLFTNLDSTGKGYVSVEDYALWLAKHCRAPPQAQLLSDEDGLDGFEGSALAARALASNHRAQLDMERYLAGEDAEDDSGPLNRSGSAHYTPYYPISPFRNSGANQHAGIAAAVEAGQQAQQFSSPHARNSRALDESYAFLSPAGSRSGRLQQQQQQQSNLLRPPMPSPEDILALFRKHDRSSHGRLGFVKFCRAFLPLLPSHGINDEFETALAALPQQFSHFVEAGEVGPPEAKPTVAANGVLSPARESHAEAQEGSAGVAENGTPWSSPSPAALRSRLSLAQESLVLRLLLSELHLESQLNFEDCNLSLMGQGQGAAREWSDYALQLQGADPFRAPRIGFDLIALYSYLSSCIGSDQDSGGGGADDGFLTRAGLASAFERFGMEPDAREIAYMIHRMDRDADGKIVYTDFAECFLPYALNLLPYDPEARASSDGTGSADAEARRIQPRQPFPFLSLPVPPADLMRRLLHPPVASLSAEDQAALRERAEDEAEMERQARRAEQLRQQAAASQRRTDEEILEDGERREDEYYSQQQQQQQSPQHYQSQQHQSPQTQAQDRRQVSFEQAAGSPQRSPVQYQEQFAPPGSQQTSFAATQFRSPGGTAGAGGSVVLSPINRTASVSPSSQHQHQQHGSFVRTPHYNPPAQLFHRPVTHADGQQAASTLNAVVAGMAPELSSALPQGFPFVLQPPREAPAPPVTGVLASALPRSSDGKSIEQVRAEQLATYQQFAAHAAVQNQQVEQHARARELEREIKEQVWSPQHAHAGEQMYSPSSARTQLQTHLQQQPQQFSSPRRAASPYAVPTSQPHVRLVPGADGGVAVDVWYQQDPQQPPLQEQSPLMRTQQQAYSIPVVTSPSHYSSPRASAANAAVATALAPGSLWSRAAPAQSAAAAASSIQTSNSSLARAASSSAALPLHDARFAPSYPLRFPVETLASQVHQTLYFPIPLAVPSAMLPLSDASLVGGGGRLAAEISQQAVVASLAGAQARANQAVRAEQMRKAAFQANVQRITASLAAQMHSNAQALAQPPSIPQARAIGGAAHAAILPMNHQNTASSYRGTGLGGAAASDFTAATWAAAERAENIPASTSFINPAIYSRPPGPSMYRPLDPSDPLVNLPRQRAVQALSLESIHAHRVSLQAADEAARDADIRAQQAEMQESMRRHAEQLYELRQTHRDLSEAREEKEQWDQTQHEATMAAAMGQQQPWSPSLNGSIGSPALSRLNSLSSATGGGQQQQQQQQASSVLTAAATGGAGGAGSRGSIGREGINGVGAISSAPVDVDIGGRRATTSAGGFAAGGPPAGGFSAATAAAAAAARRGRAGSPNEGGNDDAADGRQTAAPRSSHTFARMALPAPTRSSLVPPPVTSARAFAGAAPSAASLLTPAAAPKPQFLHMHDLASPSPMQPPKPAPEPPTTGSKPLSKLQAAIAGSKLAKQGNDAASPTRNLTSSFK